MHVSILGQTQVERGEEMKAAIYCRVSTDNQEAEGTSLDSQLKACLDKAQELGYEIREEYTIRETYSGLTLDRPKLNQLRQWVRDKEVDVVVAYTLDRLSRDPVHFIILQEELERAGVALTMVTEDVDSSDMGKLIAHIKGFAAKLEAEKIKERTMRGKRARALAGKLPANSHAKLYGYSYVPGKGVGEGIRYIHEEQAAVVREIYQWLLEGLSTDAITYRLREVGIPTPSGKGYWIRSTVLKILKNSAYCGKTYAFTCTYGMPTHRLKLATKRKNTGIIWKPREQWVEIPNATPAIISEETFNAAQEKLAENRRLATRNKKHEYLLGGYIYCARCGRAFWGAPGIKSRDDKHYEYPFYQCSGRLKKVTPVKCCNKQHNAHKLEESVWAEVDKVLTHPESVVYYLEHMQSENGPNILRGELDRVDRLIENRQKQKDRINRAFQITGDEATFRRDIALVTKEIQELEREHSNLEVQLEQSSQLDLDIENIRSACELVKNNLKSLSFEEKRFALRALKVRVLIDGDTVSMQGWIPPEVGQAVNIESGWHLPVQHRGNSHEAYHQAYSGPQPTPG
jgi:site-specific DNA recombinase